MEAKHRPYITEHFAILMLNDILNDHIKYMEMHIAIFTVTCDLHYRLWAFLEGLCQTIYRHMCGPI